MESLKKMLIQKQILPEREVAKFVEKSSSAKELLAKLSQSEKVSEKQLFKAFVGSFQKKSFCEFLVEEGYISLEFIQTLITEFGAIPLDIGQILVKRKVITEEEYSKTVAAELGLKYVNLAHYEVNDELFNSIDVSLMRKYCFIPHKRGRRDLFLIMADPGNVDEIEDLEVQLGTPILPMVASRSGFQ